MSAPIGGVDGCRGGWLLASAPAGESSVQIAVYPTFERLLHASGDLAIIAVDIPIGLTEQGARPTDQAARALLGIRGSSVFPAPVRAALGAATYEDACALSFDAHGKKLSKQAFAIMAKIREVDEALRRDESARRRVREIHPEVSFCVWNGGSPMSHPKRDGLGFVERFTLVETRFPGAFETARKALKSKVAADDDILDSLAALWSAERMHRGVAKCIPDGPPQLDGCGLPMAIWA